MAWIVLLSIIALPLVEIALFIEVAQSIGILPAIAGAIIAGIAGVALWRHQGLQTLLRARQAIDRGEMPVAEVFDGLCLLVAGLFLILPGFLSDVIGLVLLLPPVRLILAGLFARRFVVVSPRQSQHPRGPVVIETDYHEVPDDATPKP